MCVWVSESCVPEVRSDRLWCGTCGIKFSGDSAVTAMDWSQDTGSPDSWMNDRRIPVEDLQAPLKPPIFFFLHCISCIFVPNTSFSYLSVWAAHAGGEGCGSEQTSCSNARCYAPVPCAGRVWLELPEPGGCGLQLPWASLHLAGSAPWCHGPWASAIPTTWHAHWAQQLSSAQGKERSPIFI